MAHWIALHHALIDGAGLDALLGLSVWLVLACGRVSLGNAGFAAIGGFVTIALAARFHVPAIAAVAAGVVCSAVAGLALGTLVARASRAEFAVATLAFGVLVESTMQSTHARVGAPVTSTWPILAALALLALALWLFMRSREGQIFPAVAQDEQMAAELGMDRVRVRLLAVVGGALIAGFGGALIALHRGSFEASDFGFECNVGALAAAVIGGIGSVMGPIIGALVLAVPALLVTTLSSHRAIVDAGALLASAIALPGGLTSAAIALRSTLSRRTRAGS